MHKVPVFAIFHIEIFMVGTLIKYCSTLRVEQIMTKQNFWLLEVQDIVHYIIRTYEAAEIHQFYCKKSCIILYMFQVKYCIKYTCWDV